jgi:hypothetical protein
VRQSPNYLHKTQQDRTIINKPVKNMEPLEERIARLPPEQRKEVEDFVDFLLLKNTTQQQSAACAYPVPPVLSADPTPAVTAPLSRLPDPVVTEEPALSAVSPEPCPPAFHEIGGGSEDRLTHDFMDYSKYEQSPSPATEAVVKVKRKIIARQAEEKPRHLLDWVD